MARLNEDTRGNLNVDFLIGLVIFIGAFLYIVNLIPGIFLPYQTNSVDLGSVVYRTSCLLAEDPGWYLDPVTEANGTEWEYESTTKLARVGLAVDRKSPNVLSLDKISRMKSLPYVLSRDHLGLNNTLTYNYSLRIGKFLPDGTSQVLLNISEPCYASNVESIDRMVVIREGEGLYYDNHTFTFDDIAYQSSGATNLTVDRHPCFDKTNITIRLTDCVPNDGTYSGFMVYYYIGPYYSGDAMVQALDGSEFYLYKNNVYKDIEDLEYEPFYRGDKIDIVLDMRTIQARYTAQGLNVSRIMLTTTPVQGQLLTPFPDITFAGQTVQDYNLTNPNYRYFDARGMMTLEVWQV